jgi:hypothetical protein
MSSNSENKSCPACGRIYTDARQTFCLEDGNRLVETPNVPTLQPTIASPQAPYPPETVQYPQRVSGKVPQPGGENYPRPDFVPPGFPISDQSSGQQSKAPRSAMRLAIVSLAGPLFGLLGLIIRILKTLRMIEFEGRIGLGGLAGGLGLVLGVSFGIAGLIIGLIALKKIRAGDAPAAEKWRAMLAIIISGISIVLSILIFIIILSMLEIAAGHFGTTG